MAAVVGCETVQ